MRLRCPNCDTELDVHDTAMIGRTRSIRCAACEHTFRPPPETRESAIKSESWEVEISNGTLLICSTLEELARWVEKDVVKPGDKARRHQGSWETVDEILHQLPSSFPSLPGPASNRNPKPSESFQREDRETIVSSEAQPKAERSSVTKPDPGPGSSFLMLVLVAVCAGVVGWWAGHVGLFVPDPIVPDEAWKHSAGIPPGLNQESETTAAPTKPVPKDTSDESTAPPEVKDVISTDAPALEEDTPISPMDISPPDEKPAPTDILPEPVEAVAEEDQESIPEDAKEADADKKTIPSEKKDLNPERDPTRRRPTNTITYDDWMDTGNHARDLGEYQDAIDAYREAANLSPSVEPLVRIAKVQLKQKKFSLASKTLKQALKKSTSFPWVYYGLGQALEKSGQSQEALGYYRQYLAKFPDGPLNIESRQAVERLRR